MTYTDTGNWMRLSGQHQDLIAEVPPPVEPAEAKRFDSEGRDVTTLPGLWDESDVEREQFKAGDWVVVNDGGLLDGRLCELNEVGLSVGHFTDSFGVNVCMELHRFRRATSAEIAGAKQKNWTPFSPVEDVDGQPLAVGDTVTCIACDTRADCRAHFEKDVEYPVTAIDEGWIAVGGNDDHQPGWCPLYFRKVTKPQPDADGWIEWNGGECPVSPTTKVDVRFREAMDDDYESLYSFGGEAGEWEWDHNNCESDIVAYRLAEPAKPAPLDWVEVVTR